MRLLKEGKYRIRGTTRDLANEKKIGPLKEAYGKELFSKLELVEADLTDRGSLLKACKGANYIIHTASPLPLGAISNEEEIINPAVEGMKAIMEAARENRVKKVVYLSSLATIAYTVKIKKLYTPQDWSEMPACSAYEKSKLLAEKYAWDYVKGLKEDKKFDFCTINPGLVMGPSIKTEPFSSGGAMTAILKGLMPAVPRVSVPISDVRDVCDALILALETEQAAGKRFIIAHQSVWFRDIGKILAPKFKDFSPV